MQLFVYAKEIKDSLENSDDWEKRGVAVSANDMQTAQALAAQRGADETWKLVAVWPSDKRNDPAIVVGCRVQIIRQKSMHHFLDVGLRCDGIVTRIDPQNTLAGHRRPVFVQFDDRGGEWSYGFEELAWVDHD
jgi:hypothetical protein